jgi:hypothetical protein
MMMHGTFFAGPMYNVMYRFVNPFYLKHVIPKLMPWWTKNFTNLKRTITGTVVDLSVFSIPISTASIGFVGMIENKGNIYEAAEKVYR